MYMFYTISCYHYIVSENIFKVRICHCELLFTYYWVDGQEHWIAYVIYLSHQLLTILKQLYNCITFLQGVKLTTGVNYLTPLLIGFVIIFWFSNKTYDPQYIYSFQYSNASSQIDVRYTKRRNKSTLISPIYYYEEMRQSCDTLFMFLFIYDVIKV